MGVGLGFFEESAALFENLFEKKRDDEYLFSESLLGANRRLSGDLNDVLRWRAPLQLDLREIWPFLHDLHTTENRSW